MGSAEQMNAEFSDAASDRALVARWWRDFADDQCRGYSPLYEQICRAVAEADDVLDLVLAAPRRGRQPNVLLAAVHHLLLGGLQHELGEVYAGTSSTDPGPQFLDVVRTHAGEIAALLETRRTNTNECGRTAVLVPGLRWIADRLGEPLCLLDAGTSAGLNLRLDAYLLDYGDGRSTGPADSSVRIECAVSGEAPIRSEAPAVRARIGLDQTPVDLDDADEARWLLACVWPDTGRLERTKAAIALARRQPYEMVQGDMVDDLVGAASRLPDDGPLCIMSSWALAYLRRADRVRFVEQLALLSERRPVAWLSAEGPGVVDGLPAPPPRRNDGIEASVLGCLLFERGQPDAHLLASCHPHGNWLEWLAT